MFVTEEEAAAMYARWCWSWYGVRAKSVVKSKIRALMAKGDRKGVKAWQDVAHALENKNADAPTARDIPGDGFRLEVLG